MSELERFAKENAASPAVILMLLSTKYCLTFTKVSGTVYKVKYDGRASETCPLIQEIAGQHIDTATWKVYTASKKSIQGNFPHTGCSG